MPGFPQIYYYGEVGEYLCLVIDLLGDSLESLFQKHETFSLETVCNLGL